MRTERSPIFRNGPPVEKTPLSKVARISRLKLLYDLLHEMTLGRRITVDTIASVGQYTLRHAERLWPEIQEAAAKEGLELGRVQDPDDLAARWMIVLPEGVTSEEAKLEIHESIRRLSGLSSSTLPYTERYFALKAVGLCRCKKPLSAGRSMCERCEKASKAAQSERFKRRRSRGQCIFCGEKARPSSDRCERCTEQAVQRISVARRERYAAGLCRDCDSRRLSDQAFCRECSSGNIQAARDRAERLAEAGLCRTCAKRPVESGTKSCVPCRDARRQKAADRYQRLKDEGLCVTCRGKALPGRVHCAEHVGRRPARSVSSREVGR